MDLLLGPALEESLEDAPPLSRSELAVGARIPLPAFQAQSRNNMSWKGSQVFRVAALQALFLILLVIGGAPHCHN